jgi:hypothetical protein
MGHLHNFIAKRDATGKQFFSKMSKKRQRCINLENNIPISAKFTDVYCKQQLASQNKS